MCKPRRKPVQGRLLGMCRKLRERKRRVRKNSEESSTQWTTGIAEVQPPINWEMKLCALAALAAAITSSAVASSFPNRMFSRMLVANSAGSWLTSPICARSHFSRSLRMSTPSTITSPADGSSAITVDLPDPLPPTSATVRPAGTRRLRLTKMGLSGQLHVPELHLAGDVAQLLAGVALGVDLGHPPDHLQDPLRRRARLREAALDNGVGDDEDGATLVAMGHDEAASVPDVEGQDGEGDAVATDGDALGKPLLEPQSHRLLECR
uniref:Uncharacterized protein n=1 Tax=Oryza nivara TaxID=4536 RepID=A0A0E0G332_ORYNI